ncbi:hypothetical protein DE146DRAFT_650574 [Phaeosphaeria sp. MPI-PUGE-AT-0046c]|nr:hypothetical protein DE146DRAFT_650574 [Phaeosphaeria sp. MPI-PUGE-AT-0046c]
MFRQVISRTRSISMLILRAHTFSLNVPAAKARVHQWEPSLRLPSRPSPEAQDTALEDQYGPWFNTYTAFDPGCARPFFISGFELDIKDLNYMVPVHTPITKAFIKPGTEKKSAAHIKVRKPWPYSLPKALQPQVGTSFAAVYGAGLENAVQRKRVSILQEIMYGIPGPKNKDLEMKESGFLDRILSRRRRMRQ